MYDVCIIKMLEGKRGTDYAEINPHQSKKSRKKSGMIFFFRITQKPFPVENLVPSF